MRLFLLSAFIPAILVLVSGCRPAEPDVSRSNPIDATNTASETSLQRAFDLLNKLDEWDPTVANVEIIKQLRQWWGRQGDHTGWQADPFVQQLPEAHRGMVDPMRLATGGFEPFDVQTLQEATWMRNVARSVLEQSKPSPDMVALLSQLQSSVAEDQYEDLRRAVLLFDWTVRNLQVDAPIEPGKSLRFNSNITLQPWESLLFGRGTLEERSRVFLLLCRQMGLPVVILGIEPADGQGALRIWLPALMLGNELYLFEMRIGIPVPGPDLRGIATLAQVVSDPAILQQLKLTSTAAYPVGAQELARIVALIDVSPPEVSRRMELLQNSLTGDNKLVLSVAPGAIATKLQQMPAIRRVDVWTFPYDGYRLRSQLAQNQTAMLGLAMEHGLFDRQRTPLPMAQARILHLRGKYDGNADGPGAREYYLQCRAPESQIRSVADIPLFGPDGTTEVQATPDDRAIHQRRLELLQAIMRRIKENASYWLGLIAFDRAEYDVAIDFFEKRLLDAIPESSWKVGATYNLARAYEARGRSLDNPDDLQKARQLYESLSEEPSSAALQWRAELLRRELGSTPKDDPPDGPSSDTADSP